MNANAKPPGGFEGKRVLESLLCKAEQPKSFQEIQQDLLLARQENLLPSEVLYRVLGKKCRKLPSLLARRLAANLFALYDDIGRESFEEKQRELLLRAKKLHHKFIEIRSTILKKKSLQNNQEILKIVSCLQEAEDTLRVLQQNDLNKHPSTRRLCANAEHTLTYLATILTRVKSVLQKDLTIHFV